MGKGNNRMIFKAYLSCLLIQPLKIHVLVRESCTTTHHNGAGRSDSSNRISRRLLDVVVFRVKT